MLQRHHQGLNFEGMVIDIYTPIQYFEGMGLDIHASIFQYFRILKV